MTARRRKASSRLDLQGKLWITVAGENFGGRERIGLLRAVKDHGSITRGAKAHGLSYKAAWDAIDLMNTLAGEPLAAGATYQLDLADGVQSPDGAREYLRSYFTESQAHSIDLFWGSVDEFVAVLSDRMEEAA